MAIALGRAIRVEHKPLGKDLEILEPWLPEGKITVGVTSGASTPDKVVEEVMEKILAIKKSVNAQALEVV